MTAGADTFAIQGKEAEALGLALHSVPTDQVLSPK